MIEDPQTGIAVLETNPAEDEAVHATPDPLTIPVPGTTQGTPASNAPGKTSSRAARKTRGLIVTAALDTFMHYGYHRTTLELIAKEAGLSRTSLYHHFRNKEEIFVAAVENINIDIIKRAQKAARSALPIEDKICAILECKLGFHVDLMGSNRHRDELLHEGMRLAGDLIGDTRTKLEKLTTRAINDAIHLGELDLRSADCSASELANLIYIGVTGLYHEFDQNSDKQTFHKNLWRLVRLMIDHLIRR
jgi:AcrR family transcriptional regulator